LCRTQRFVRWHTRYSLYPAIEDVVFEANIRNGANDVDLAAAHRFAQYGIAKDNTTGYWFIDVSETSNKRVTIVDFKDPVGTENGRVYFKFMQQHTIYG